MNTHLAIFVIMSLLVIGLTGIALYLHEQNQQLRGGLRRLRRELEEMKDEKNRATRHRFRS